MTPELSSCWRFRWRTRPPEVRLPRIHRWLRVSGSYRFSDARRHRDLGKALLLLERNGYHEETERVSSERQLATLSNLAASTLSARTRNEVLLAVHRTLQANRHDFPFGFMRLFDGTETSPSPTDGDATIENAAWPFAEIAAGETNLRLPLAGLIADPPTGAWDRPPRDALIVPITKAGQEAPSGAVDRTLFTENANFYLTPQVLADLKASLGPLGPACLVSLDRESKRGGMMTRHWMILCGEKRLAVVEHGYPDDKLEQFMVRAAGD